LYAVDRAVSRVLTGLSACSVPCNARTSQLSAENRSLRLLKANLSPRQREQYAAHGYFDAVGSKTAIRYRIHHACQLNIEQLDAAGKRVRLLCFKPTALSTVGDIMLAQKLALELFEEDAIRVSERFLAAPPCRHYVRGSSLERYHRTLLGHDGKALVLTSIHGSATQHEPSAPGLLPSDGGAPAKLNAPSGSGDRHLAARPPTGVGAVSPIAAASRRLSACPQTTHAIPRSEDATRSEA
jgi:hypothetical protein